MPFTHKTLEERFNDKWIPEPNTGCWIWTASVNKKGYGSFSVNRRPTLAHRVAWMFRHGSAPSDDICVCHRCDTPPCVNPDHLFLGTQGENQMDSISKGRKKYHFWAQIKEHREIRDTCLQNPVCKRGHLLSGDNLYVNPKGYPNCKTCININKRRRKLKARNGLDR